MVYNVILTHMLDMYCFTGASEASHDSDHFKFSGRLVVGALATVIIYSGGRRKGEVGRLISTHILKAG